MRISRKAFFKFLGFGAGAPPAGTQSFQDLFDFFAEKKGTAEDQKIFSNWFSTFDSRFVNHCFLVMIISFYARAV